MRDIKKEKKYESMTIQEKELFIDGQKQKNLYFFKLEK
jgi:hypothetical protein